MKLKTSSLVAVALLMALTAWVFVASRARQARFRAYRRAHVPEKVFLLPPVIKTGQLRNEVEALCFAPQGNQLLISDVRRHLYLADLDNDSLHRLSGTSATYRQFSFGSLSFSRDGSQILNCDLSGAWWRTVKDANWQKVTWKGISVPKERYPHSTAQAALSPTARYMLNFDYDKNLRRRSWLTDLMSGRRLWDVGFKKPIEAGSAKYSFGSVFGWAFSPNEKLIGIAIKGGPASSLLKVEVRSVAEGQMLTHFEIESEKEKFPLNLTSDWFLPMAFSPDGRLLALGGMREARLYSTTNGTLVAKLPIDLPTNMGLTTGHGLLFSPDGLLLAFCYGSSIEVWNVKKRSLAMVFSGYSFFLAFSPDSKWLASQYPNGTAVWEVGSLE